MARPGEIQTLVVGNVRRSGSRPGIYIVAGAPPVDSLMT